MLTPTENGATFTNGRQGHCFEILGSGSRVGLVVFEPKAVSSEKYHVHMVDDAVNLDLIQPKIHRSILGKFIRKERGRNKIPSWT